MACVVRGVTKSRTQLSSVTLHEEEGVVLRCPLTRDARDPDCDGRVGSAGSPGDRVHPGPQLLALQLEGCSRPRREHQQTPWPY